MNKFIGAIIQNPKYGFLLQQRTKDAPTYPLRWSLFGGAVEAKETPKQAILRELQEEINLGPDKIKQIKVVQRNIQKNGNLQIIFYLETSASLKDLTLKEGKQMKFATKEKLFRRKFAFNIKEVLEKFLNLPSLDPQSP